MISAAWLPVLVALTVLVGSLTLWCYFTAQRLNRLHIRLDRARDQLEAALNRRAGVIAALHPELGSAAETAESIELTYDHFAQRREAESALMAEVEKATQARSTARTEQRTGNQPKEIDHGAVLLADAAVRVNLAMRFYNQAVQDTRLLRGRPLVRALRLSGNAPTPVYF